MGTTAVSVLEQRLSEQIGDYLEVVVTTAIAASTSIVSTNLRAYDGGRDDYFNDWWVYITDKANAGVQRQISDYATATGTITVLGANLSTDGANLATIRLHRYNRDKYINAFNDTVRELSNSLFKNFDIKELITGNILPNSHFRDWTLTTTPDKYAMQDANITAVADTTAGEYRGGAKGMKATTGAGGAGKYVYITSDSWPQLLDLMGKTVNFYCWAYPEAADDATIVIYTLKADSTAQTLTSTTTCPAGKWSLLKLESQALNDDLVKVEIRFAITTASKYVIFDNARLLTDVTEYLLPIDARDGTISNVYIQSSYMADFPCDDLSPISWEKVYGWEVVDNGTDKFLQLPYLYTDSYLIRLEVQKPLSTVSAYTDTIEVDGDKLNLFIAYAKYKLWQAIEPPVATKDIGRYESQSAKAYNEYLRLRGNLSMKRPKPAIKMWTYNQ